jgi:hypothetical protein
MAKGFKQISVTGADYEFYEEFAKTVSAALGTYIKISQAIKMAVTQYEVKNGAK